MLAVPLHPGDQGQGEGREAEAVPAPRPPSQGDQVKDFDAPPLQKRHLCWNMKPCPCFGFGSKLKNKIFHSKLRSRLFRWWPSLTGFEISFRSCPGILFRLPGSWMSSPDPGRWWEWSGKVTSGRTWAAVQPSVLSNPGTCSNLVMRSFEYLSLVSWVSIG